MLPIAIVLLVAAAEVLGGRPPLKPGLTLNSTQHGVPKIIGGQPANDGQFPWIVSLNYQGDGHACGASVLTKDFVLTAAHCCEGGGLEIYAGSIYLGGGGQRYPIDWFLMHQEYNANEHWRNDICVMRLGSPLPLGDSIKQVALPYQGQDVPAGAQLTIPGWGYDASGSVQDRLQVLYNDAALSNDECSQWTGVNIYEGQLCTFAGYGLAICSGDSGGPLTLDGVQVGLTSWGYLPCGGTGWPDVFTRVTFYVDWIRQVLGPSAQELKFAPLA